MPAADERLADGLILDELLDLTLYKELRARFGGPLGATLDKLIAVEERHYAFWRKLFGREPRPLDVGRRAKLAVLVGACRVFGETGVHLVLEATEIYGIRKYLAVWRDYKDQPLGQSVKEILIDEFQHEEEIVAGMTGRRISPERIRSVFFGMNDGLVEILGALSGFFASLQEPRLVLMASASVAVAGALSMAAGAYVAGSSEREVQSIEKGRAQFLGGKKGAVALEPEPMQAALLTGLSYFAGAMIPVAPLLFGVTTLSLPLLLAALLIIVVSTIVAYLSGMDVRRRIALNVVIMAAAVGVTYAIGGLARRVWGISV